MKDAAKKQANLSSKISKKSKGAKEPVLTAQNSALIDLAAEQLARIFVSIIDAKHRSKNEQKAQDLNEK